MELLLSAFGFQGAFQRPQRDDAAAVRNLQADAILANGQRQHARGSYLVRALQRGDAQRKSDRLESRRFQGFLQPHDMVPGNRYLRGKLFPGWRTKARIGNQQSLWPIRKTSFRFDLQKTADIGLRQVWQFGLQRERPTQRDA